MRGKGRGHHLSQVESVRTWGANSFKDSYTWSRTLEEVSGLFPFHTYFFYLWKTQHCLLSSGYFIAKIPAMKLDQEEELNKSLTHEINAVSFHVFHGSRTSSHRLIWPHKVSRLTWTTNSACPHPITKSCSIITICCPPSINKWGKE